MKGAPDKEDRSEDRFEDLAASLKEAYGGFDVDAKFTRELLVKLEAELGETAPGNRAVTPSSAILWKRRAVVAAGLAACAAIGWTYYIGKFHEPQREEPRPTARTLRTGADAFLAQHVALRGVVVSESGEPVENARIVNLGHGRVPRDVLSRSDGTFVLPIQRPTIGFESVVATSADGAWMGIHNGLQTAESSRARTNTTPLRIVLKPAHVLHVRVRDGRDNAVRAASVEFIHRSHLTAQATTDAAGVAALLLPRDMEQDWQALAFKSELGFDYEVFEAPTAGDLPREVDLVLDGARTVRVRAVGTSGEPLSGALFFLNRIHKKGKKAPVHLGTFAGERQAGLVRTGPDGFAALDWLPPAESLAEVPGVRLDFPRTYYLARHLERPIPSNGDTVEITLWRTAEVRGRVRGADGRAAAGILIRAEGISSVDPRRGRGVARTAEDGSYVMRLPPNHFYMLVVVDDRWGAPARAGILLEESASREGVDFRLKEGTLIHGKIVDGSKSPLPGQALILRRYGDDLPTGFPAGGRGLEARRQFLQIWTTTDTEGYYAFRVGPGDYRLAVGSHEAEIVVTGEREIVQDFEV